MVSLPRKYISWFGCGEQYCRFPLNYVSPAQITLSETRSPLEIPILLVCSIPKIYRLCEMGLHFWPIFAMDWLYHAIANMYRMYVYISFSFARFCCYISVWNVYYYIDLQSPARIRSSYWWHFIIYFVLMIAFTLRTHILARNENVSGALYGKMMNSHYTTK